MSQPFPCASPAGHPRSRCRWAEGAERRCSPRSCSGKRSSESPRCRAKESLVNTLSPPLPPPAPLPKGIVIVSPSQVPLPGALSHAEVLSCFRWHKTKAVTHPPAAAPPAAPKVPSRRSLVCPSRIPFPSAERSRLRCLPDSVPPALQPPRSHSAFLTAASKGIKAPFLHRGLSESVSALLGGSEVTPGALLSSMRGQTPKKSVT